MITYKRILVVAILKLLITSQYISSSQDLSGSLSNESEDNENKLKQALFLVKLLKSDYMKSLRQNELGVTHEEDNSTCPENATIVMDINSTPRSQRRSMQPINLYKDNEESNMAKSPLMSTTSLVIVAKTSLSEKRRGTLIKDRKVLLKRTSSPLIKTLRSSILSTTTGRTKTINMKDLLNRWSRRNMKYNSKNAKKMKQVSIIKQRYNEKSTTEDFVLSQVAAELSDGIRATQKTENISGIFTIKNNLRGNQNLDKQQKGTMKIYLQGSSRIPIPFPENNAFCHLFPQNKLCGTGI